MSNDVQIKGVLDALETVQSTIDQFGKELSTLEKDKVDKAANDFATKMEEMQKESAAEASAQKARIEELELAVAKSEGGQEVDTKEYENEFKLYLRKSGMTPSPENVEKAANLYVDSKTGLDEHDKATLKKDLVSGSNPDGGYLILPDRASGMITRQFETSPMRQIANVVTTASNEMEFILDDDEASAGWVGETEARTKTNTPQFAKIKIPVMETYANLYSSQRMLDDAGFNLESWIIAKGTDKMSRMHNTAFVAGDGVLQPRGFTTYGAWDSAGVYKRDAIEVRNSGEDGGFGTSAESIIDLQSDLHEAYQTNAVFGGTRSTLAAISKEKDSQGVYLFDRSAFLANGMKPVILNKEFVIMADMPEIATDALALVYGNFKAGYTIVDRIGIRVLRDPYSAKPNVSFYMTQRVGGAVTDFSAIKLLKLSA